MAHKIPYSCPACNESMNVTELTCSHCMTKIQGIFETTGLQRLKREQLEFVEVFIRCRGNIKEVEKDLKISYPTVRSRLDQIISDMGYSPEEDVSLIRHDAADVIDALGKGEMSFEEALAKLKGVNES